MKLTKIIALILCLAIAAAALAACQPAVDTPPAPTPDTAGAPSPDPSPPPSPSPEPSPAPSQPPAPSPEPVVPGRPTIYVIVKAMGNAYWGILQAGAIDAGREFDANVIITGIPDEARIEDQITLLQNAVSAKADAILIAVANSVSQAAEVERAYDSNIPIILVDTMADTNKYTASFVTNNVAAGESAAEELIRILKDKNTPEDVRGTIGVQIGSTGSQTIIDRITGFRAYWDAHAPANWVVDWDGMQVNDGDISKAVGIGQNQLVAYPDLIAFFTPNNGSTVGAVTALVESGRKDIAMLGFDFSKEMEEIIRSGEFHVSTMLQNQYFMGFDGVKAALDIIAGNPILKDNDTGLTVVNASNVDDPEVIKAAFGGR